jgi:hypothetical protein
MLVHAETFHVLNQARLNAFVQSGELGTGVGAHLSLETVDASMLLNILRDHHTVEVNLSVHGSGFNKESLTATAISDKDGKVNVVLTHALVLLFNTFLLFGLLFVGGGHAGLKFDFDFLIANLLGEGHLNAIVGLVESKSTFVEVGLDVLKLSVVLVFVLDFLFEGLVELASTTADSLKGAEKTGLVGAEGHNRGLGSANSGRGDFLEGEHNSIITLIEPRD